jgi:glycosyltransferase involved in cell wall biosynthesis
MKVLLSDNTFAYLTPGGKNIHVTKLLREYKKLGVDVQFENWWDSELGPDIVHFFGFPELGHLNELRKRGIKLVYTHIMDGITNSSSLNKWRLKLQYEFSKMFLPKRLCHSLFPVLNVVSFDRLIYMNNDDRDTAVFLYGCSYEKTRVIGHAVSYSDFENKTGEYDNYFVCTGTIISRKNQVLLAKLANSLGFYVKFIGHNYGDSYYNEFVSNLGQYCKYLGRISEGEKHRVLAKSKGFILLSDAESGCISVYEAAYYGLPIILPDKPWARHYPNPRNIFLLELESNIGIKNLNMLVSSVSPMREMSFDVMDWSEVAIQYNLLYEDLL